MPILVPPLLKHWQIPFRVQTFSHLNHVNNRDFKDSESNSLSVLCTNCDSPLIKWDELFMLISCHKPKTILLTEI